MYIRLGFLVSFKNMCCNRLTAETDVTIWLPSTMPDIKNIFKKVLKNVIYANTSSICCYFNELNIYICI